MPIGTLNFMCEPLGGEVRLSDGKQHDLDAWVRTLFYCVCNPAREAGRIALHGKANW
jgi:hypothetical protein